MVKNMIAKKGLCFAIQRGEPVVKKMKSISKTPKEFNKSK